MSEPAFSQQEILLQSLLMDLEAEMRLKGLWSSQPPAPEAFASEEPFCIDTMDFAPWLQFVFIARLNFLMECREPLPDKCGITPYAEMIWQGNTAAVINLLAILKSIDDVFEAE